MLTGSLGTTAFSSVEWIAPIHKVSLTADTGKLFGEVGADLQTTRSTTDPRISSIVLTVKGKKYVVPQASFKNLKHPRIETASIRTEGGGRDGGSPWLYLMFQLRESRAQSSEGGTRVYIRFRDGKLQTTHVWDNSQ